MVESTLSARHPVEVVGSATWRVSRGRVRLAGPGAAAELWTRLPMPGLRNVALGIEHPLGRGPVLGVEYWRCRDAGLHRIAGRNLRAAARVRGTQVDIEFEAGPRRPVGTQLYWQFGPPERIDMQVLAATPHFVPLVQLELITCSMLPAGTVLVSLAGRGGPCWTAVSCDRARQRRSWQWPRDRAVARGLAAARRSDRLGAELGRAFRMPMVIVRPAHADWSYVEMSHPDDCRRIVAELGPRRARIGFGLFGLDLEKGVILRGRVRGCVVPRDGDTTAAEAEYRLFTELPPPLAV